MENNRLLKLFYAAVLSDAAYYYDKHGIIDDVTEEKKACQLLSAESQLKQLEVETLEQLYSQFTEIFGCAPWNYNDVSGGEAPEAVTKSCLLCAMAKKQGSAKPCVLFCINPFKAFAEKLGYELQVKSTLWDGSECCFSHRAK